MSPEHTAPSRSEFLKTKQVALAAAGVLATTLILGGLAGCATPEKVVLPVVKAEVSRDLEEAAMYQIGEDRAVLARADARVAKALAEGGRQEVERQLLNLLGREKLPDGGRDYVIRALQQVASGASVMYLEPYLAEPKWRMQALNTLASIPGMEAELVLLRTMSSAEGELRLTLVSVAGQRRMSPAVTALAGFVRSEDDALITAALKALGQIGDAKAFMTLRTNPVTERHLGERMAAIGQAMARLTENETAADPVRGTLVQTCRDILAGPQWPVELRASALRSLVLAGKEGAAPELVAGLCGTEPEVALTAVKVFLEVSEAGLVKAVVKNWGRIPLRTRASLLEGLSAARDVHARELALEALRGAEAGLKVSALKALAQVGTKEDFEPVFGVMQSRTDLSPDAAACIAAMKAPGLDEDLRARLAKASPELAAVLLEIGTSRKDREFFNLASVMIESGQARDKGLRAAALETLATLAVPADIPRLCGVLLSLDNAAEVQTVARAVRRLLAGHPAPGQVCEILILATKQATPVQKRVLRQLLAAMSLPDAVQFMAESISRGNEEEWRDQVRILGASGQFAHVETLMGQLSKAVGTANRVLVVRSVVTLIHQAEEVAIARRADAYVAVWPSVIQDEDRLVILADMEKWRPETAKSMRAEAKM